MDWFKMQTVWGASLERLSDPEAGRFIKAVYAYVRNGTEYNGNGKEAILVLQALETLHSDIEKFRKSEAEALSKKEAIAEKRRNAAMKRWGKGNANDASECKSNAKNANASICMQVQNLHANASQNKNKNKIDIDISSSSCSNDAHAREDTGAFTGLGAVYSDAELAAMQKQRMEDIPAIERLMRECGYAFSPADETIAIELLNSGETTDGILDAIRIAKESNALNWRYIKGVLKKQKEGSYGTGTGTGSRRTGTASAGTGSAESERRSSGKAADDSEDDFDRYLKSCIV